MSYACIITRIFFSRFRRLPDIICGMTATQSRRRERIALTDWAANDNYTHSITLNTDRELSLPRIKDICSTFCHLFDKNVHGIRNARRFPVDLRMRGIFFPENLSTNAHLHGAVDLSAAMQIVGNDWRLEQEVRRAWKKATRGAGSVDLTPEPDSGWFGYCTKRGHDDHFFAADFHPQ
ncbi:MAG: hypothetical protein CMN25_01090 [Salinicola sp.]|nr:hypothetical protein [Salinicola sp.]